VEPDGSEQRREVLTVEPRELAMKTLGMNLSEEKAPLAGRAGSCRSRNRHMNVGATPRVSKLSRSLYQQKNPAAQWSALAFGRVEVAGPPGFGAAKSGNKCPRALWMCYPPISIVTPPQVVGPSGGVP
jgi:hypothetical protein